MRSSLRRILCAWVLERSVREEEVPIASCVHYAAFRYGGQRFHPYETYVQMLATGDAVGARRRFVSFLRRYRPRDLGEALGVELERSYPLWQLPWTARPAFMPSNLPAGWYDDPEECPDIITHFSPAGILRHRIEQEFYWLERSYYSLRRHGFDPARFGSVIRARRLQMADGEPLHLIEDGNHRIAAMAVLGYDRVRLRYPAIAVVKESRLDHWPLVRARQVSAVDARRIMRAYAKGHDWKERDAPMAAVLEPDAFPWRRE